MELSVIIPTHNRPATLRKTLDALRDQTLSFDRFEAIVVDDGSDEASRSELRRYEAPYRLKIVEKEQGGLASARNLGADHASGDILYFLDDDVVPDVEALEQHLRTHAAESRPVAVIGALPYPRTIERTSFLWYLERSTHYDLYKNPKKYPGGKPPLPPLNGNSSVSRAAFFGIGKYDETFRQYGGEDLELGYRLGKSGVRFVYNPRAVGYHHHLKDFSRFCIDMEAAGESLIHVYRKFPEIREAKKIDILEDRLRELPVRKKIIKMIMSTTLRYPWILVLPRWIIRRTESVYRLRRVTSPFYRWVAHYHYALGMQRSLAAPK